MLKSYKVKLKVQSKKQSNALKSLAGTYRKIYNTSIDLQQYWLDYSRNPKHYFMSKDTLLSFLRKARPYYFPFVKTMDNGMLLSVASTSKESFQRWFENLSPFSTYRFPKYKSRKKDNMSFKTSGDVKVFYDYITIPKLGKIKLWEKGYLPQGKRYSDITFSHDGKDWFISLKVAEVAEQQDLKGTAYIDFDQKGTIYVNGKSLEDITVSESYKRKERKQKSLEKKLKRQSIANIVPSQKGVKTRTSKNMIKVRKALAIVKNKLSNLRKDSFKKQANLVARTKPEKLVCLSSNSIRKVRNSGLTRTMREKHTLDLFSMIVKKVALVGAQVTRLEVPTKRLLCTP